VKSGAESQRAPVPAERPGYGIRGYGASVRQTADQVMILANRRRTSDDVCAGRRSPSRTNGGRVSTRRLFGFFHVLENQVSLFGLAQGTHDLAVTGP
jgi:hypothetical protein